MYVIDDRVIILTYHSSCNVCCFSAFEPDMQWSDDRVKLLIDTLASYRQEFDKPKCKKAKIWKKIADTMKTQCPNLQLTGSECDRKWRNLIQTFRKQSDKKKKTGRGAVHWKFYKAMQMATKDRASIQPDANVLVSSMQDQVQVPTTPDTPEKSPNVPESTATREASPMKRDAAVQTPTKATRKRKAQRSQKEDPPAWFVSYMKQRGHENDLRWQAAQELEKEKIEVMKKLIDALKPAQ